MKQYMPKKPIKRGIKVWVLADSTNGYFSRMEIYTGKKGSTTEHILGSRVVKELTSDFQYKWHHVFFDNFFTSKALLCDLEAVGLYGCGTARKDRKYFPVHLKKPKLRTRFVVIILCIICSIITRSVYIMYIYIYRGESLTVQSDNLSATAWMDSKIVMAMYNCCDPTHSSTVLRRKKDGTRESVVCPEAIKGYNESMGGVDQGDQLRGYYHVRMKCRKVYKYIYNFLFDVSITNAFILYQVGHPGSKMKIKDFRVTLANYLIGDYCSKRPSGRQRPKSNYC